MEFDLFLDEDLIKSYERAYKAEVIEKRYNIPAFFFAQSSSNSAKQAKIMT